jgi:spermidine/putrescine transport system ATP-binding protein
MSASADAAVELRGVAKRFGSTVALHQIDLTIRKGEFFSLLGPSGCGKTTTLNLIGGFETPSEGTLLIDGQPVQRTPPYQRPVNTVFQNYALFPHMSVAQNVEFGLRMKDVPKPQRQQAVAEMLRLVSLEGYGERRPAQLSGGQRQRVALARALVNRPSVLLLDEPLGALDLKLRKQMQAELTRIQRQVGITFVYVTHDQEEALAMSDRIAVMDLGRLLQVGTPAEIYDAPAGRAVFEFIGSVNVIAGRTAEGGTIDLPGLARLHAPGADALAAGTDAVLLVRPERVRVTAVANPAAAFALSATMAKVAHLGLVTHCTLRLDNGTELLAFQLNSVDRAATELPAVGQRAWFWWAPSDARVYAARAAPASDGAPLSAPSPLRGDEDGVPQRSA